MNKFCRECNHKDQCEFPIIGGKINCGLWDSMEGTAEWVQFDDDKFRCSNCDTLSLILLENGGAKNFCPNCGRKITGVRKAPVYHIGFDNHVIYAGMFNPKNDGLWYARTECTDEALCAVRDYMIDHYLHGLNSGKTSAGIEWETKTGKWALLRISVED